MPTNVLLKYIKLKKQTRETGSRDDNWEPFFFRLAFRTHITRLLIHTKGCDAHMMQDDARTLKLNIYVYISLLL